MTMGVQVSVHISTFSSFGKYPDLELWNHMVIAFLISLETSIPFSIAVTILYPHQQSNTVIQEQFNLSHFICFSQLFSITSTQFRSCCFDGRLL